VTRIPSFGHVREMVLRWMGALAVIPLTAAYVALGVALLAWRAVRDAVPSQRRRDVEARSRTASSSVQSLASTV